MNSGANNSVAYAPATKSKVVAGPTFTITVLLFSLIITCYDKSYKLRGCGPVKSRL